MALEPASGSERRSPASSDPERDVARVLQVFSAVAVPILTIGRQVHQRQGSCSSWSGLPLLGHDSCIGPLDLKGEAGVQ